MATTAIKDSRVAIVGGSIAGCAAAIALQGKVKSITIFERSKTLQLEDRGQGIGMAKPMQELFSQKGFLTKNYRFVQSKGREWFVKDDDTTSALGRKVWTQPIPVQLHNWGLLWRDLREAVDADFRPGVEVGDCNLEGDGVELFDSAGDTLGTFDICLAADGSNSILHKKLLPDSKPNYSGYVLWRGSFPIEDGSHIPDINYFLDQDVWTTVGYPGGHIVSYAMPSTTDDRFLINWALYGKVPMDFDTPGVARNIPTEVLQDFLQTAEETLPPFFAQIVNVNKEEISIHPVFDESPDRFVHDSSRLLLLGDAGASK
jgi:2-polyprenyl-6-methoxyphenol hydroxylase-like FAD-dependent oxidoreductase